MTTVLTRPVLSKLIKLADAHQKANEYDTGHYEWNGTACAIGCTIRDAIKLKILPGTTRSDDHEALDTYTHVPIMVWWFLDSIFEGLDKERAALPPRFLRAIRPNADYKLLPMRIMARLARRLENDAIRHDVKDMARIVAELWESRAAGIEPTDIEWDMAEQKADLVEQSTDKKWWGEVAWLQAVVIRQIANAAGINEDVLRAFRQAKDAWISNDMIGWHQFWSWCADMLCEELQRQEHKFLIKLTQRSKQKQGVLIHE